MLAYSIEVSENDSFSMLNYVSIYSIKCIVHLEVNMDEKRKHDTSINISFKEKKDNNNLL